MNTIKTWKISTNGLSYLDNSGTIYNTKNVTLFAIWRPTKLRLTGIKSECIGKKAATFIDVINAEVYVAYKDNISLSLK